MSPVMKWTFCETSRPAYKDLVHLSQVINYHKRRMWSIMMMPYQNGYEDDSAEAAIEKHIQSIEDLHTEYSWMIALLGTPDRVA